MPTLTSHASSVRSDEQRERSIATAPEPGKSNALDEERVHSDPRLRARGRISQRLPPQSPPPPSPPPSLPAVTINAYGAPTRAMPTPKIDLKDVCPCSLIGHQCPNPEGKPKTCLTKASKLSISRKQHTDLSLDCDLISGCIYWLKVPFTLFFPRFLAPHSLIILTTSQDLPPYRTANVKKCT